MSFASNVTAFGLKPAPTPAPASGTSLFGQKPAGTSLFGNISTAQPQSNTGGLFGSTSSQPAASNSLFGTSQNSGSLFGGQNQQQNPNQQPANNTGGGLFGSKPLFGQPQQQNTGTGSLFGQPQQQQQQQSANTGGLFGQPQSNASTGLFGQQPAASGGLFGQSTTQQPQQNSSGGSFFGNTNQTTQAPSLFGGNANVPQSTQPAFGPSLFASKANVQQQMGTASQAGGSLLFTKSTKFNDLPENIKKQFENIESHIQGRIQVGKQIRERQIGQEATKGRELIRTIHKDMVGTTTSIRNDLNFTRDLKSKADQAVQDTLIATQIVDGFRNPQVSSGYLKDHASFPLEFFTRVTKQMREKLLWYKATVEQIERKLSSMSNQSQYTPQGIVSAIQAQHSTFIALANQTAALDIELEKIKTLYTQLWRTQLGTMRDPFNELDSTATNTNLGLSRLSVQ